MGKTSSNTAEEEEKELRDAFRVRNLFIFLQPCVPVERKIQFPCNFCENAVNHAEIVFYMELANFVEENTFTVIFKGTNARKFYSVFSFTTFLYLLNFLLPFRIQTNSNK